MILVLNRSHIKILEVGVPKDSCHLNKTNFNSKTQIRKLITDYNYWNLVQGNKIVWDFDAVSSGRQWGAEAQILCKDPNAGNDCYYGTHDCSEWAQCIENSNKSEYTCQCPEIKWGDRIITATGSYSASEPCKYIHPDFPSVEMFPIELNGEIRGLVIEEIDNDNDFSDDWPYNI